MTYAIQQLFLRHLNLTFCNQIFDRHHFQDLGQIQRIFPTFWVSESDYRYFSNSGWILAGWILAGGFWVGWILASGFRPGGFLRVDFRCQPFEANPIRI